MSNNFQAGAAATWTKLTSPTRTEGHPQNILVLNDGALLATFSARINGSNLFTQSSGVFLSSNGGTTWTDRSDPKMTYYTRHLSLDPTDSAQNTWYVGTYGDWGMGSNNISGGLFKTTDRGQHWSQIYSGDGVESVTVNPTNADELYVATSRSGLLYSSNATSATPTFTQLSSYPFARPAGIFFNPYDNDEIWIASAGNGLRVGRVGHGLTVNKGGAGSGTVTSSPAGISCGSGCSSTFSSGTSVTLTANADSGSTFSGWAGGGCTGTGMCSITMTAATTVTATFNTSIPTCTYTLSSTSQTFTASAGSGTVTVGASSSSCTNTWTAISNVSWITITAGSSGTGNGTVVISVAANTTGAIRTGNITIADQTVVITQSAAGNQSVSLITSTSQTSYDTIQAAYEANTAVSGSIIKVQGVTLTETLLFSQNNSITLTGAYDSTFTTVGATMTTVSGSLTISGGVVTVANLVIQ